MVHVNIHSEETELIRAKAYREKRSGTEYFVLELYTEDTSNTVVAFYATNPNALAEMVGEARKVLAKFGIPVKGV